MHEPPQSDLAVDEQLTKLTELLEQANRILADIIQARRAEPRAAIADPRPAEPEHPRDDATAQHEREQSLSECSWERIQVTNVGKRPK